MNWRHKLLPNSLVLAMALVLAHAQPADAIYCANCGTEWTQLANNLQLADQLQQQIALVQKAIQQYQNLVTNTKGLDTQTWSNALAEIQKLNALLAQAKSLSFAAGNLDGQFARKYGNYQGYVAKALNDEALGAKYQQWSEDTNSSVLTTLKGAGLEKEQIEGTEEAYLRHLQGLAETAEGRMQALQVGNQIAIALARQMQKLRQLMLVQLQLQANYIQTQMDRDVAQTAAWRNFAKRQQFSTSNGKRY